MFPMSMSTPTPSPPPSPTPTPTVVVEVVPGASWKNRPYAAKVRRVCGLPTQESGPAPPVESIRRSYRLLCAWEWEEVLLATSRTSMYGGGCAEVRKVGGVACGALCKYAADRGDSTNTAQYGQMAVVTLTRAAEFTPEDPDVFYHRGWAYADQKLYTKAIQDFTRLAALEPASARGEWGLANCAMAAEDPAAAMKYLHMVLELKPDSVIALYTRAVHYYKEEAWELAGKDARAIVRIAPKDVGARQMVSLIDMRLGFGWNERAFDDVVAVEGEEEEEESS